MAQLTRAQAADKAGVEPEYVDRLVELGIVVLDGDHRLTTGDVRRTQMARTLEGAGIGLEALAAGMRSGRLSLGFMDTPAGPARCLSRRRWWTSRGTPGVASPRSDRWNSRV